MKLPLGVLQCSKKALKLRWSKEHGEIAIRSEREREINGAALDANEHEGRITRVTIREVNGIDDRHNRSSYACDRVASASHHG